METREIVAVKVIKNKPTYFNQSMMEVTILELVSALTDLLVKDTQFLSIRTLQIAEQPIRPERRTQHPAVTRLVHPPQSLVFGIRALVLQPSRID